MAEVFFEHASAELATLSNTFEVDSVATDPTTISLVVTTPSGTSTTYTYAATEITKVSTGVYRKDIACTEDGIWSYVWVGTGTCADVAAGTWTVSSTFLRRNYCSVEELRDHVGDTNTTMVASVAQRAVDAASRWIDRYCGRKFWLDASTTVRVYRPDDPQVAWVDDIGSTTSLVIKTDTAGDGTWATTWDAADYQLEPLNLNVAASGDSAEPHAWWRIVAVDDKLFPVSPFRATLQVTARHGWSSIPEQVNQASILISAALYERRNSPQGVAGFADFGAVRIGRQDPDVARLLGPFRRNLLLVV